MDLTLERTAERDAALQGMLPHVPFDGWTKRALRAGLRDAGLQEAGALLLFPLGMLDLIEAYFDLADRRMAEAAALLREPKISARVRAIVRLRLEQDHPHKEAVRRALAILALPRNAPTLAKCIFRMSTRCGVRPAIGRPTSVGIPSGDLSRRSTAAPSCIGCATGRVTMLKH